jgi:uncharacterized protein YdeI (YjbR/CyaY-like superfamily)
VNGDAEILEFSTRARFREWLAENQARDSGIWVVFIKGDAAFTANDALEEAICFGWIDGVMKSIDEKRYRKYFSRRKDLRKWSAKNQAIYKRMVNLGLMTQSGIAAFQAEGDSDSPVWSNTPGTSTKPALDAAGMIRVLREALSDDSDALGLYDAKPPSRQRQLAGFYCDAKTEATRDKRKGKITEALRSGYSGMLY